MGNYDKSQGGKPGQDTNRPYNPSNPGQGGTQKPGQGGGQGGQGGYNPSKGGQTPGNKPR
jgi:hypothetical protein